MNSKNDNALNKLENQLKSKHMVMLAIAGVIGAALFVGSGKIISVAGPSAILSYSFGGILVLLVMRMLGEMAVSNPDTGSFSTYAEKALGGWAGFTIGWLYWYFWVFLMGWEAYIAGVILNSWLPILPIWFYSLAMTISLIAINCLNVKNFGEIEFWFALIKVIAIICFLVIGTLAIFHLWPWGNTHGMKYLIAEHGFFPNGFQASVIAMLGVMFAFLGAEIPTIAASESKQPKTAIIKATKTIGWRISLFYVGSIFIIVCLVPWNSPELTDPRYGSYYVVLKELGFKNAELIVNFVVLTSVSSCFNSALYTSSRMLFSLAKRGDMHPIALKLNKNRAPYVGVFLSSIMTFIAIYLSATSNMDLFDILMQSTGAIGLYVYLTIALSQLKLRQKLEKKNIKLELKMWCFPWLTYAVLIFIIGSLLVMMIENTYKQEVLYTTMLVVVTIVIGIVVNKRKLPV